MILRLIAPIQLELHAQVLCLAGFQPGGVKLARHKMRLVPSGRRVGSWWALGPEELLRLLAFGGPIPDSGSEAVSPSLFEHLGHDIPVVGTEQPSVLDPSGVVGLCCGRYQC